MRVLWLRFAAWRERRETAKGWLRASRASEWRRVLRGEAFLPWPPAERRTVVLVLLLLLAVVSGYALRGMF